MTVLRVFDTVLEARRTAECTYKWSKALGIDLQYHAIHPYVLTYKNECDIYVANRAEYCLGWRVNKIKDYTRNGVCDEIRACEYESKD